MGRITEKKITTKHHKMKVVIEHYDSAQQVVEDCRKRNITDDMFENMQKKNIRKGWHGVDSYDEALEFLSKGYQPTVEKLKESLKNNKIGSGKRITFKNDIVGAVPVVPLAIMGVPNNMVNTRIKPIKNKIIDIYYDMTCCCGTSPEDIIKNGQKVLSAIVDLEQKGYAINLYAVQSYSGSEDADMLCVKVKSSSQPLDLKRISFPLTHTAFFRVIGFDWYSKCPKAKYRGGYGQALGYRVENKDEQKEFARQAFGENATYILGTEIMDIEEKHLHEVLTNEK